MKTKEFLSLLKNHQNKSLIFEYLPYEFVGANYHITEIKHVKIDSIDCGANSDAWNETVIQLWESPSEIGKTDFMSAFKAASILNKVDRIKPFDPEAEVKFEYSNETFHTAQLYVDNLEMDDRRLIVKLAVEKTDCKAKSDCVVDHGSSEKVMDEEPCCTPDGNCC